MCKQKPKPLTDEERRGLVVRATGPDGWQERIINPALQDMGIDTRARVREIHMFPPSTVLRYEATIDALKREMAELQESAQAKIDTLQAKVKKLEGENVKLEKKESRYIPGSGGWVGYL